MDATDFAVKTANDPDLSHDKYNLNTARLCCCIPAVCCGICGMHQCYLGDYFCCVIQCLTFGGCGILSFLDILEMDKLVARANERDK